jgi:hypothetical protein
LAAEFAKSNWQLNLPSKIGSWICQIKYWVRVIHFIVCLG